MGLDKRLLIFAILCLLYTRVTAETFASVLSEAPECATTCLFQLLDGKAFEGQTQAEMCHDKQFADTIGECLLDSFIYGLSGRILVILQIMISIGLGLDMWYISSDYDIQLTFKYFLVIEVLYLIALVLVKAAILSFFLRIFPDHKFRIIVKCTMIFNILVGVAFFVVVFLQTTPLSLFWEGWEEKKGDLIMSGITHWSLPHAGLNLLLDVWMLILPLTQLWELGLKLRRKAGVISMFSVGLFLTIVAAIRVYELVRFACSINLTVINAQVAIIWSIVEISVGVMVACMPQIRHLICHILS
ncbi:hypothetical protein F53441_11382 [Fusarium austroafricanum]|uniref:Rhodopsin domain-containing protein n=1 Tax=Fusarium austroafricanum TaxID=2364996 RepID=A0A8H4K589_9HYPO|nr:hypothetical protein F53441_11382 [Fusarium austroafricanum]